MTLFGQKRTSEPMIGFELATEFVRELAANLGWDPGSIEMEIQDDFKLLLVSLRAPADSNLDTDACLRKAQVLAQARLPWREGEYSWMVNVVLGQRVVNSTFGGNLSSSRSGLIA